MSIEIATDNSIFLDGARTGLKVTQTGQGTVVYIPENAITGVKYKEHAMPKMRYSLAHNDPKPKHATLELAARYPVAGRAQFEADIRVLLAQVGG